MPRTSVSSPFLGGCRRASLWNWARVQNLARGVALSPKLGGDCVSQAGPAPAAQHLHGMRCRDGSPGPTTLVRARRNARGTDTSAGQQSRARHGGTYTKIGSIQRRLAWPLRRMTRQIREALHLLVAMFVPLYSSASSREYRRQRPRPFCASTDATDKGVQPLPSADAAKATLNWARYKTWHAASPCPPNSAAIASVRRVQPQQPSTCTVCGVEMARGPHHLGESSQEREGYRYLERASSLVPPRRHIY
ncbi:hypothetical protein G5714_024752 [Onychostoma macrolepis]|uniref:Uncharacterized protein n=1 Tax=Onychostoma macrolepis TaxID=369639 RepID=A0A7J6BHD8_9TELE|nr:hypothetical protein G5714_024752 [Onychostoma macrolepis]